MRLSRASVNRIVQKALVSIAKDQVKGSNLSWLPSSVPAIAWVLEGRVMYGLMFKRTLGVLTLESIKVYECGTGKTTEWLKSSAAKELHTQLTDKKR